MYILYKGIESGNDGKHQWQAFGYFDTFPEAVCAMQDELMKKDGNAFFIKKEGEDETPDVAC